MSRQWNAKKALDAINALYEPEGEKASGLMSLLQIMASKNTNPTPPFTPPGNVKPPGEPTMQNVGEAVATPELPITKQYPFRKAK